MEIKTGLMILLLLIAVLISVVNIHQVKTEFYGTVYIRLDGSIDPSTAPIRRDGDVYTLTDNITSSGDGIVIERNDLLLDGAGYKIQGSGADESKGVDLSRRNNVTITNATIKNFDYGILLDASSNNTFIENNITNNTIGIYCGTWFMEPSNYTIVTGNNITENNGTGIYLWGYYWDISENNITENMGSGIVLSGSHHNVSGNSIANSGDWKGISLWGPYNNITENAFTNNSLIVYEDSYQNVVVGNTVNGKPLVYLEDVIDYSVGDAGQVILVNCTGIRVENLSLSRTHVSVMLLNTTESIVSGNNLTNNYGAIWLDHYSNHNNISRNNIANNYLLGIELSSSSNHNNIWENNIANNKAGICCYSSNNNSVSGNKIIANQFGIYFFRSLNNSFYHNNFIGNSEHVHDVSWDYKSIDPSINIWDDGYPSGGNYWSDYKGVDLYSGPYQNETGSDFIGDSPYVIDENNTDNYPLMGSWTMEGLNVTVPLSVDVALTFENVSSSGITTLNVSSTGPDSPSGFKLATTPSMYYDINTTANYTGKIQIRVVYDDTGMTPEEEAGLRLMHWNETLQEWVDITTDLDTENNVICGEARGLSLFAVMAPLVHNIAIQDVSPTRTLIGQNRILSIQVAIKNWDYAETFNLTLYANNTEIGVQKITVQSGSNTTITFTWNTTGFAKGNYTLSAYATSVAGETHTEDNIYVDGVVWVKWLYDNTGDGYCGIDDIVHVAERFGTEPGGPPNSNGFLYHPIYDITCDDYIGIDDVVEIAEHFGETDP